MIRPDPERAAWIAAHGSPRLKRLLAEGIEHGAVYRDERIALERPGWLFLPTTLELSEPRNAPMEALDLLDRARVTAKDTTLHYFRRPDGAQGYCCIASHKWCAIIFGERLELPMDRRAA